MEPSSPNVGRRPLVFISYARKDGEGFAASLRGRLEREHPEIRVWQDRAEMEGGRSWWQQITEAIDSAQIMLLIMTPSVVTSDTVRKEWRYARQRGVRVYPIKGVDDRKLDFATFPRWMTKSHFYDLEVEWETFVRHLKSPGELPKRVPFMAPELPDGFVRRPLAFDQLLSVLVNEAGSVPVTTTVSILGPAGFGKTTLAVALANHDQIVSAYDDGILWVTLGQRPRIEDSLAKLHAAITGERPGFKDVEDVVFHLNEALRDRDCLIIIDDVWNVEDLQPFLRIGESCARVFTTRFLPIAAEAPHKPIEVDVMTLSESVCLLKSRLAHHTADLSALERLSARLGEWPLLLELAAAHLRQRILRGDTPSGAIAYLNRALDTRGVVAFDRANPSDRNQAVSSAISASLDQLSETHRQGCIHLGVFPEDIDIPLTAIGFLWGLDQFCTEELAQRLDDVSLIRLSIQTGAVRLHDVVRAYFLSQIQNTAAVHSSLIRRWGDYHHLPDSYAWKWLSYHLISAGELAELRKLLFDFRWLKAKLEATDSASLIADFNYLPLSSDSVANALQAALRLASHHLTHDARQLPGQLTGRLLYHPSSEIRRFLEEIRTQATDPWLRPFTEALTSPGGPLQITLVGHSDGVRSVALNRDASRGLSGGRDGTLRLWDLRRGTQLIEFDGHDAGVIAVAMTQDGRRAVSGSLDHKIRVWDLERGKLQLTLSGHTNAIAAIAIGSDGRRVFSGSRDGTVRVWDLETCQEVLCLGNERHSVGAIAVSCDGTRLLSAGDRGRIMIWDLKSGTGVNTLMGHIATVRGIAITADGHRAASVSDDGTLRQWDLNTGSCLMRLASHNIWATCVAITPEGGIAVSGSWDRSLKIWDLRRGELVRVLDGHDEWITSVAMTADGRYVLSGSNDRTLKVWDLANAIGTSESSQHRDWVSSIAVVQRENKVISGSDDQTIKIWDASNGMGLMSLAVNCPEDEEDAEPSGSEADEGHRESYYFRRVRAYGFSPDGRWALAASHDGRLTLWDLDQPNNEPKMAIENRGQINCLAFSSDCRSAIGGGYDGCLRKWNLRPDGSLVQSHELRWEGHRDHIRAVAFVAGSEVKAVSGSDDGTIRLWDLELGSGIATLSGHAGSVTAVACAADGRILVTGSEDQALYVWDLQQCAAMFSLRGHQGTVTALAVTSGGNFAVSGSDDHSLRVWNLRTQQFVAAFTVDSPISACAAAPDGLIFVVGDRSGRLHFLSLESLGE